ncbi:MAG: IS110 family transposase [Hyphomicrobiaceae bacterium]
MTLPRTVIGCDIAKAKLDVYNAAGQTFDVVPNTPDDIANWTATLDASATLVVCEATGACDRALIHALEDRKIDCARVNPKRARDFARAAGVLAKTDRVDARVLAEMGRRMELRPDPAPSAERMKITDLSVRRDQLVEIRKQERTRLTACHDACSRMSIESHIAWLDQEIESLDRHIKSAISASDEIRGSVRLLTSIPGIGAVAATVLVSQMPELGQRSRRTIAALAGLAPINNDSGTFRGQRRIRGGRKRVRDALYMAALSASRSSSNFADFYQNRIANQQPRKAAIIALARKILTVANAVIRDGKPFQNAT